MQEVFNYDEGGGRISSKWWPSGDPNAPRQTLYETEENISNEKLNAILEDVKALQTEKRKDYIKEYYTDKKEKYITKEFKTSDNYSYNAETYGSRKPLQSEIVASAYLIKRGHTVVFLDEKINSDNFTAHPDILVDNSLMFEIKKISQNNLNTIEQNIKRGTKDGVADVPVIYWNDTKNIIDVSEVQNRLNDIVKEGTFFNKNFNYACIFQNNEISVVQNKNTGAPHQTRGLAATPLFNSIILTDGDNVKSTDTKFGRD